MSFNKASFKKILSSRASGFSQGTFAHNEFHSDVPDRLSEVCAAERPTSRRSTRCTSSHDSGANMSFVNKASFKRIPRGRASGLLNQPEPEEVSGNEPTLVSEPEVKTFSESTFFEDDHAQPTAMPDPQDTDPWGPQLLAMTMQPFSPAAPKPSKMHPRMHVKTYGLEVNGSGSSSSGNA
jgi:hypothetical protein